MAGDWILDANDKLVWDPTLPGKKRGTRPPRTATPTEIAIIEKKNALAKAKHDRIEAAKKKLMKGPSTVDDGDIFSDTPAAPVAGKKRGRPKKSATEVTITPVADDSESVGG